VAAWPGTTVGGGMLVGLGRWEVMEEVSSISDTDNEMQIFELRFFS